MSSYYALVSDDDNVVGVFKQTTSNEEALRSTEGWTSPTEEQIEEWDGFTVVTIEGEFVDVYDKMLADGEEVTLETIQPYKTEQED
jgi:hypothetical protein